ncbi:GGDEF domain-containing protein [Marinicella meishanensis]|uniref:GGDEF domain-containing protein n=1 Tax=Marinicella meishanensis TaxID=2873263 RepID=UPI001CBCB741|nr:GGDEF domain-containing protein [Marinicella sp. NBU2979]
MKTQLKSEYFLQQIYQIRQMALYFGLLCLFVFVYLDYQRFSDNNELLQEILWHRLIFQLIPIMALIALAFWQRSKNRPKHLIYVGMTTGIVLIGIGHAEILVTAYEHARYFPKVGLVIILYYAGIILVQPLLYSVIASVLIVGFANHAYSSAGLPADEVLSITVFYGAFAACCLVMNVVCSRILANNLKLIKEIDIQANTDNLTKLCNRRYFFDQAAHTQKVAYRDEKPMAIILVDLDHFKQINDSMGHDRGDQVLIQVAHVLDSFSNRPLDVAARLGGDEFVLLLYDTSETYIHEVCQKIIEQVELIADQIASRNPQVNLGVSMGVASSQAQAGLDSKTLIKIADLAMYEVKKNGKNGYQIASQSQFMDVGTDSDQWSMA